jgi:CO/xanthine dehydrogenase Mo-binding subunit
METCGMCFLTWKSGDQVMTSKKCVNKLYSNTENGEAWCKRELGVWKVGAQQECTAGSFYEAEVKGTVTGTVNDTVKTAIEGVVTKIVADQLGIDVSKVDVTVDTTTNSDGSTTFKVAVKVGTAEVTTEKFSDISKIPTAELEAQLAAQGINAQSGTVNISNNNFSGKLFVSLLVVAVLSLLF